MLIQLNNYRIRFNSSSQITTLQHKINNVNRLKVFLIHLHDNLKKG